MDQNITCLVCGGSDFYQESGFYFCNECQTQTQETRHHEFDEFDVKQEQKVTRKINAKSEMKNKIQLTTWECYNYVLKGLTEELINLGAEGILRTVVKKLWMKYLFEIEVINLDKPKLQAVNSKIDAEIVYGKRRRRKRKPRSSRSSNISDSDLTSMDSSIVKRERIKRRKALIEAQYNHSIQSMDSLHNETLTSLNSLKSSSENTSQSSVPLRYNKYAKEELTRKQSDEHIQQHAEDFDNTMTCHRLSYAEASKAYVNSPHVLSINKIYSILYLGLLLTKSKIQLSDMLRFIREGHLSFNSFKHFFPEEMKDNFLTQLYPRKLCLMSAYVRRSSFQLAKFLGVSKFIRVQNLAYLVEKFCQELNLPQVIEDKVLSVLLMTLPEMEVMNNMKTIPNYEGRALSLILFQIKLYFGIDGKTERYLSDCAKSLNNNSKLPFETFDFMKWMQYLDYRNYVLKKLHFPSQFFSEKQLKHSHLFVKFVLFKNPDYELSDPHRKYNKNADDCRQLLMKLKENQEEVEEPTNFPPSFNPSVDYTTKLLNQRHVSEIEKQILGKSFSDCSIDFIKNPIEYFPLLYEGKKVKIQLGGANENIKMVKLINSETAASNKLKEGRKLEVIRIKKSTGKSETAPIISKNISPTPEKFDNYPMEHEDSKKLVDIQGDVSKDESVAIHYKFDECFWVNTNCNLGQLSKINFEEHLRSYPSNFQFLLKEMARISEQSVQDFLCEYSLTEIYLLYVAKFQENVNVNLKTIDSDKSMKKLVRKAKKNW
ncbi:hypothetical protein HHI36_015926 [Cryptolaemus montrouzieri]|uniref:TATA box-binding protein-associated factor RNA polymerase I subunit B n=1 Tax=Cryptolaemus montrouzieri TaxID=559131 RepID=A0ABD2N7R6_9CUCU